MRTVQLLCVAAALAFASSAARAGQGSGCLAHHPLYLEGLIDAAHWAGFSPIQIKGVTFGDGSTAKHWASVSDFGGKAEVNQFCGAASYGSPFCIYPWYTLGRSGWHYGVDYRDTIQDFGQADQFQQTRQCGGPFGPGSTYCSTVLK